MFQHVNGLLGQRDKWTGGAGTLDVTGLVFQSPRGPALHNDVFTADFLFGPVTVQSVKLLLLPQRATMLLVLPGWDGLVGRSSRSGSDTSPLEGGNRKWEVPCHGLVDGVPAPLHQDLRRWDVHVPSVTSGCTNLHLS